MQTPGLYALIWDVVRQIPKGHVSTYGRVAQMAGLGNQARLVGYALHQLPEGTDVPWHRVINAKGRISLNQADDGYHIQKALLEAEGIVFADDVVDIGEYGWISEVPFS